MKITKDAIGRWATVKFTDVGRRDVLLVGMGNSGCFLAYEPFYKEGLHHVEKDQIIELRKHQNAA